MDELLRILLDHYGFLYKEQGFRFTDSCYSRESFGNAYIDMRSDHLRVRFLRDRGVISLTFYLDMDGSSYDFEILYALLTNKRLGVRPGDAEQASFIQQHFACIATLLSAEQLAETTSRVKKLKEERSRMPSFLASEIRDFWGHDTE